MKKSTPTTPEDFLPDAGDGFATRPAFLSAEAPAFVGVDMGIGESKTLMVTAPGTVASPNWSEQEQGLWVEAEHRACKSVMERVTRLGAWLLLKKEALENLANVAKFKGGRGQKGLNEWLKTYASEIPESSARRYMNIANAAREEFMLTHSSGIAKVGGFEKFALAAPEALPEKLRAKQMELWEFVNGTTGRSLLDRFKPHTPRGGLRVKGQRGGVLPGESGNDDAPEPNPDMPGLIPASEARPDNWWYAKWKDPEILLACEDLVPVIEGLEKMLVKGTWLKLPPELLKRFKGCLIDANKAVKETKE